MSDNNIPIDSTFVLQVIAAADGGRNGLASHVGLHVDITGPTTAIYTLTDNTGTDDDHPDAPVIASYTVTLEEIAFEPGMMRA